MSKNTNPPQADIFENYLLVDLKKLIRNYKHYHNINPYRVAVLAIGQKHTYCPTGRTRWVATGRVQLSP